MNQENRSISNTASRSVNDHIALKAWSKPDLVELDFVSGTNSGNFVDAANDGIVDSQS